MIETDWPPLMPDVALALLGEPSRKASREWRYGRRGSLAVNLTAGTWKDYESGEGGGVLALIEREQSCNRAGAVQWAVSQGLLPENGKPPHRTPKAARMPQNRRTREGAAPAMPGSAWKASGPVTGPGRAYLASRGALPDPLPDSVRWLPREKAAKLNLAPRLPPGAAGCLLYRFMAKGDKPDTARAVQIEALDPEGRRVEFPQQGKRPSVAGSGFDGGRRCFQVGAIGASHVHLCEGPIDALSLLFRGLAAGCEIRGAAGAGMFKPEAVHGAKAITVWAQGDTPGRKAAARLSQSLERGGALCVIERLPAGRDLADLSGGWKPAPGLEAKATKSERSERSSKPENPQTGEPTLWEKA
jgi:hypothetical protein